MHNSLKFHSIQMNGIGMQTGQTKTFHFYNRKKINNYLPIEIKTFKEIIGFKQTFKICYNSYFDINSFLYQFYGF